MDNEPTERDRYVANLEAKLKKAGRARRFLEHEDGALITEYCTTQINSLLKQIGGKALLDKPSEYAYAVGQLQAYQKLLTMLNSEANTNTAEVKSQLQAAQTDV